MYNGRYQSIGWLESRDIRGSCDGIGSVGLFSLGFGSISLVDSGGGLEIRYKVFSMGREV